MPSWKKVIVSGSDATLNSLLVSTAFTASGLNYPSSDGTSGQVVITDGAGNLSFSNVENTTITIKNVSGTTIQKGTPCYITGSGTSGNISGVWPADASNPLRMPAGVIAGETLTAGAEGIGLINGFISGVNTSAFVAGDSVYVAVGGGYTNVRPTGSAVLVQKLGNVEKSHISNGSGVINGPGYYNDLPNVQQGYTWVGNSNGVAVAVTTSSIQNVVSSSFAVSASRALNANQASTISISGISTNADYSFPLILTGSSGASVGLNNDTVSGFSYNPSNNLFKIFNLSATGSLLGTASFATTASYTTAIAGTDNYIPRFNGSSALENSVMYDDGTNIGIGSTSPATKLEVFKSLQSDTISRSTAAAYIRGSDVGLTIGQYASSPYGTWLQSLRTDDVTFPLSLNPLGGNVGISTSNPSQKLEVNGNILASKIGTGGSINTSYDLYNNGTSYFNGQANFDDPVFINGNTTITGSLIVTTGITGSLHGTASFASTASFVNTLNQNVLITGSATIGSTSAGASENTLTLGARDGGSEGGQLGLNAPGGTYTSASMIDNYNNNFRILKGTNSTSTGLVAQWNLHTTQLQLPAYTSTSAFSGTVVGILGFDSSGNILTTTASAGGGGGGSGTVNSGTSGYIAYYPSTGTTVDDTSGVYWDSGNSRLAVGNSSPSYKLDVSGDIRATGAIYANANGAMYFQGGDDAALYDVNVANTMGIYGQQDSTIGSIKLGSSGGVISGYNSNIGIGTTSPAYKLDVSGTFRSTGDTILANASNVIIKNASNYPVFEGQSSSAQIGFSRSGTTDITYIGSDSSYLFRLWDESFSATYFNILQNGNTGIGTASPSTKLHLSGTTTILTITDTTYSRTSQIGYVDSANLYLANDSNSNTYIGAYNNVFLGYGGGNIGIGTTSPAYRLSIVGKIALNDGGNSIFIGDNAGSLDDASANINVGIGQNALQNNITGNQNVAIGNNSLPANNQSNNTAVGSNTMQFNTSGFSCTGIGSYALNANSVGTFNTAVGTAAMITNTSGSSNTAIGSSAQRLAVSGSNNVSLGSTTLYSNLNGNDNVAIGNSAGRYYSTGTAAVTDTSASIFIGRLARAAADSQVNQIVIGMDALGLGSNTVVLGNDNIVTTALKGNVAIGKTSPNTKLDVSGNTLITGSLQVTAGITGSLNGNADSATNSSKIAITGDSSGTAFTLPLILGTTGAGQTLYVDSTPAVLYTPSTNQLWSANLSATGSLQGTATSAGNATTVTWTDSAAGSYSIATSDGTTAYYDAAGDARWDGSAKVLSVNTGAGEQLNLQGKYIEQTGTGLLNYYADRHVFGDNAYNYQGQLIGGSFDAAQDITCGGTKYFDIPHQSKPGWGLKHGAIEGPESAVYFRGKLNGSNVIEFPAYWEWLVHSDSITVSLTSIGSFQPLYVAKIENNQAVIASNDQPINCHFVVYGERKDVERWDVEYPGYSRGQIADTE